MQEPLTSPPPGYIPSDAAVRHYHFSVKALIDKRRAGSLRHVFVHQSIRNGHPWAYYSEHDLRRLYRSRAENVRGGPAARYKKLPPWLARDTTYPVPAFSEVTYRTRCRRGDPKTQGTTYASYSQAYSQLATPPPGWLPIGEACAALHCSSDKVCNLTKKGAIRTMPRAGNKRFRWYNAADIAALAARTVRAGAREA